VLIRKIELQNFMSYENSVIELPKNGVVVITGANGSGKSSIAEATATSVWGKTLRGSSPWVADKKGFSKVSAEIAGKIIEFTRQTTPKGKVSAKFDPSPANYATATKTQNAIDSLVGDFDTWRKCAVFSSQDAAHFTLSTDAERKRLLESLLGLDKFDIALKTCRDEQKIITAKIRTLENDILKNKTEQSVKETIIEEDTLRLRKARSKADIEGAYSDAEIKNLEACIGEQQTSLKEMYQELRKGRDELSCSRAEREQHTNAVLRLDSDTCPTCRQSLKTSSVEKMKRDAHADIERVSIEINMLSADQDLLDQEVDVLEKEARKNEAELAKQKAIISVGERSLIAHLEASIKKAKLDMLPLNSKCKSLGRQLEDTEYDLALSENTQTVLGTKGVRAHILTSALGALEITSNKWLRKIASKNARISIRPYVENKSGGIRESISLDITGIGSGEGYKSLSGGQRRRVDVALLLGLSELAQAANQHTKGTVFFDEVFDSLDSEGVSAVSSVIEEMATDRSVIIISHSEALVDSLSSCAHYVVENGEINLK